MEFIDYKCLESLLIEGEDLIATEGLGSKLLAMAKGFVTIVQKFIGVIVKITTNIISAIKRKINSAKSKAHEKMLDAIKMSTKYTDDIINNANQFIRVAQLFITKVYLSHKEVDNNFIQSSANSMKEYENKIVTTANLMERKYGSKKYTIDADVAETLTNKLYGRRARYQSAYDELDKLSNTAVSGMINDPANTQGYMNTVQNVSFINGSINKIIKAFNSASEIIINAQYIYGNPEIIEQRVGTVV